MAWDNLSSILLTFAGGLLLYWVIRVAAKASSASNVPRKLSTRPEDIKQLNDSVWEFYKPSDGDQKMDIILFHGCQLSNDAEAFWKTWLSRDETTVWPKVWLAQECSNARILSISYDSSARISSGSSGHRQRDTYQTVENLMEDLVWSAKVGQNRPVIFAGHCFGGIIIKDFLIKCHEYSALRNPEEQRVKEMDRFIRNCKGIFYYSTPNGGSNMMDGFAYKDYLLRNVNEQIVDYLKILSKNTARINNDFRTLRHNRGYNGMPELKTRGIGELQETRLSNFTTTLVVPEGSARQDVDSFYTVNCDHFNVARAENDISCSIFTGLRDLVKDHYNIPSSSSSTNLKSALPFSKDEHYVPLEATLREVDSAFKHSQVVVLHGDSGMGKSSLARHFALLFEEDAIEAFKGGPKSNQSSIVPSVLFIICGEKAQVINTQQQLLINFKADYEYPSDWKELPKNVQEDLLQAKLNDHMHDRQALVILDDVWEKKLVEKVLVREPKVKYLITSRNRDVWRHNAEVIEITGVDMNHCRGILAKYAKSTDSESFKDQADELIRMVKFHPLALATLGVVLQTKKSQSVHDWQKLKHDFWRYSKSEDDTYYPTLFNSGYPRSVYAAMMLMVNVLDDAARIVLHAINIFRGKRIPEPLVELLLSCTRPDVFENFCLHISTLERLSLVRRETELLARNDSRLQYGDDDEADFFNRKSVDVFVIHDLRRTFLSEDVRRTFLSEDPHRTFLSEDLCRIFLSEDKKSRINRILNLLGADPESLSGDRDKRSKYNLAILLLSYYMQRDVNQPLVRAYQLLVGEWEENELLSAAWPTLVLSMKEHVSNSTEVIEAVCTTLLRGEVDLDNMSSLLRQPNINRYVILLVYDLVVRSNIPLPFEPLKVVGFWESLIQLLFSPALAKFEYALLSILRYVARRNSLRVVLMRCKATTNLLDKLFVTLEGIDGRGNSKFGLSIDILKDLLQVSPYELEGPERDNVSVKITRANNLRVLARVAIQGPRYYTEEVVSVLGSIIHWCSGIPAPGGLGDLVKYFMENSLETTSLLEMILKRCFLSYQEKKMDTEVYLDSVMDVAEEREDRLPCTAREEKRSIYDYGLLWDLYATENYQEKKCYSPHANSYREYYVEVLKFAAIHLRNSLITSIMRVLQCMEKRQDKYASFIAELAKIPPLALVVINQDCNIGLLDKLAGLLDGNVNEELQIAAHKALLTLARTLIFCYPATEIQVEMLETEHLRNSLITSIMRVLQCMEKRQDKYASFIAELAKIPPLALVVINQDCNIGLLDKLAGLLDGNVNEESQIAALKALLTLARTLIFCYPATEIQVEMLETEHLLERVTRLLLSKRRGIFVRAGLLLVRLVSIEDSRALQGPFFLSLSSKAQHFRTCLEGVEKLVVEKESRVIGLKVLLCIYRLAFEFTEIRNSNLVSTQAISDLLSATIMSLSMDVLNPDQREVKALAIIAQFRFDKRLCLEEHMKRLATEHLLVKLAMVLLVTGPHSSGLRRERCSYAVGIIVGLVTVPAIGELVAEFCGNVFIDGLLKLLVIGRGTSWDDQMKTVEALVRLPVRNEIEAQISDLHIAPQKRSRLYSRWAWKHVMQEDYKAALKDLNRAIELESFSPYTSSYRYFLFQERGIVRRHLNDLNGALEDLDRALKMDFNNYECRKHRGLVKYKLDDVEGARRDADWAINVGPFQSRLLDKSFLMSLSDGYDRCLGLEEVKFLEYQIK